MLLGIIDLIVTLSVVSVYHNEKCVSQEGGTSPMYKGMAIVRGQIHNFITFVT